MPTANAAILAATHEPVCFLSPAAGLLIQVGSAPCAVSSHAAVAFTEWRGDVGLRGWASAARARSPSNSKCSSAERRALERLGACGVRGAGQFSPCAGRSADHRRDPRRAFLITPRSELITSSMAGLATTNADWPGRRVGERVDASEAGR